MHLNRQLNPVVSVRRYHGTGMASWAATTMIHFSQIRKATRHLLLVDYGPPSSTMFLAGMGRSGTTWAGNIINYDGSYRVMFEPFLPALVSEAKHFEYIQYLNPRERDPLLVTAAQKILAGKVRNRWVDRENRGFFYRQRIVKDIRCNLMLRWLRDIRPSMPIVLLIRHPLAVAASWVKLGWGVEAKGQRTDLEIITSQLNLLDDFPIVSQALAQMNRDDSFERIIFEWCVLHLVPFRQFAPGELFVLVYENLILQPEAEIERLFSYLKTSINWEKMRAALPAASSTNFLKRDIAKERTQLLTGWRNTFSDKQIEQANRILQIFALDDLYDEDGYPSGIASRCRTG